MSGSSVRRTFSDERTSTLPPVKNRSGIHVRPLRSRYVLAEPAIILRSPPIGDILAALAGKEGDFASTVIVFTACVRHNANAPMISKAAVALTTTGALSQAGRFGTTKGPGV